MTDRESFLATVAAATGTAELPAASWEPPALLVPELPKHDLAELFTARLEEVDGVVHRVTTDQVPGLVVELIGDYDASSALVWSADDLGVPGLADALRSNVAVVDPSVGADRAATNEALRDVQVGITGASAALAESGSIVVTSGSGRSRMASVVPLVHIAIVPIAALHRSLSHFVAADPDHGADAANLVVITGPSRTGDIEQQLNLGVHGPKHLHVLLVE